MEARSQEVAVMANRKTKSPPEKVDGREVVTE
jgi:hypothetical protein